MRVSLLLHLSFLFLLVTGGQRCSAHFGAQLKTSYPDNTTINVMTFTNNAPLAKATFPQTFTESLRDGIQSQTRVKLTNGESDLVLEGSITNYGVSPIAIQGGNDQAALNRLSVTINVKFTDLKDEKKNFEQAFTRFADYSSSKNLQSVEDDLLKDISNQIVQDIINRAINVW